MVIIERINYVYTFVLDSILVNCLWGSVNILAIGLDPTVFYFPQKSGYDFPSSCFQFSSTNLESLRTKSALELEEIIPGSSHYTDESLTSGA